VALALGTLLCSRRRTRGAQSRQPGQGGVVHTSGQVTWGKAEPMSTLLYTLGHRIARHRWKVLVAWCLLAAAAFALAGLAGGQLVNDYTIPGTESQRGIDTLAQRFPQASGTTGQVVFTSASGPIADPQAAVEQRIQAISKVQHVTSVRPRPHRDGPRRPADAQRHSVVTRVRRRGQPVPARRWGRRRESLPRPHRVDGGRSPGLRRLDGATPPAAGRRDSAAEYHWAVGASARGGGSLAISETRPSQTTRRGRWEA
jgi:hypothetical protein